MKLGKTMVCILVAVAAVAVSGMARTAERGGGDLTARQEEVHAAAELLRELGVEEDSEAIRALSDEWWRCEARRRPCFTEEEVVMLAKTMYGEAGGVDSLTEVACVGWTVCNHADDPALPDTIAGAITAPGHFHYRESFPVREDLLRLARDVLERWNMEKLGRADAGRVLPPDYLWYSGDGRHNYFRNAYRGGRVWDYSLGRPYDE